MQAHFSFLGDDHNDSAASDDALKEAAALYLDPRNRLLAHGSRGPGRSTATARRFHERKSSSNV
jgi:hypothetical protein